MDVSLCHLTLKFISYMCILKEVFKSKRIISFITERDIEG